MLEHLHERLGGPIQDGNFDRIDVDENVVDAAGIDGREKMFGGGKQDALLHQAGGVADAGYVMALGFDGEIVEIHAAKYDTGIGRRGRKSNVPKNARVQPDALGKSVSGDGGLEHVSRELEYHVASQHFSCLLPIFSNL
jgi:hypothetical protein